MIRYVTFGIFFSLALGLIYEGGIRGAEIYERLLADRIRHGLAVLEIDWLRVEADGTRIELHGRAPSVEAKDLALATAHATAPNAFVVDYSSAPLSTPEALEPVDLEVLRDPSGITITGRHFGSDMRSAFTAQLRSTLPDVEITDVSGINAARPMPDFGPELDIAALALGALSDAYVTVSPGRVGIEGVVPDEAAQTVFRDDLLALAGPEITLEVTLKVPPRAIAPFEFSASKTFGGLRVETCSARSLEERDHINAFLFRRGAIDHSGVCVAGLGGPAGDWVAAIEGAVDALDKLPAGRLRLSYHRAILEALPPTSPEVLEDAVAVLSSELPPPFFVSASAPDNPETAALPKAGFWLDMKAEPRLLTLQGRMPEEEMRDALVLFAKAMMPQASVEADISVVSETPPTGWQLAAQTAIEGLAALKAGSAQLSPGRLSISGSLRSPTDAGILHRDLQAVMTGYEIESEIEIDLPDAVKRMPLSAQACASQLNRKIQANPVEFETGNAKISDASGALLDALTDVLARCPDGVITIAGFTDSQGAETFNQTLSQKRAEAVMDALIGRGVNRSRLVAAGFGEAEPVASNATPEGRAKNRRIEFRNEIER